MISNLDNNATLSLVEEIVRNSKGLRDPEDNVARLNVIAAASKLISQLSTPMEHIAQLGWGEPSRNAALRTAFDLGLLQRLGMDPLSSTQLAEGTVADPGLVARIMKNLAAYGYVNEISRDKYTGTPFSMAMNDPSYSAGLFWDYEGLMPVFNKLPDFLSRTNYQIPTNGDNCAVQLGLNTTKSIFAYLQENARLGDAFNKFMTAWTSSRPRWTDLYPCEDKLITNFPPNSTCNPIIVDLGGGLGHDLLAFHDLIPTHSLSLILQETPTVLSQCPFFPPSITPYAHDFFTPQPPAHRRARAYHLRQILHNWPDEQCHIILSHLRDAMVPGESKLLINEKILSDVGAQWQETSIDLLMMAMFVGRERMEGEVRGMLERAGLRVEQVWGVVGVEEKIVEAVRV